MRRQIAGLENRIKQMLQDASETNNRHVEALAREVWDIKPALQKQMSAEIRRRVFLPPSPVLWDEHRPFMPYSTCSAADFMHPRYAEICAMINHPVRYHRKIWEWVFVIHHLLGAGVLREGAKGIVFGVGRERLPALFAKLGAEIVATDAPDDIGEARGWKDTNQHSGALSQIRYTDMIDGDLFDRKVSMRTCDMNNINPDVKDFDFTWSSCCFEHLGTLEAGAQFVINSVEKTLKIGGTAVHTTEFNMSSNTDTVTSGETVIYRKCDIEDLVKRLEDRGHKVSTFSIAPDTHYLDGFVDVPPYAEDLHIKLEIGKFVTTSVGLVVTRGR
jgi:hypothetical protein